MAAVLSLHCFQKPYSSIASPPLNPTPLLINFPNRVRIKRGKWSNSSITFSEKDENHLGFFSSNSIVKRYDQGLNCSMSGSGSEPELEPEPEPKPEPKGDLDDNVGVKTALSMLRFYKSGSGFDPPRWFGEESTLEE